MLQQDAIHRLALIVGQLQPLCDSGIVPPPLLPPAAPNARSIGGLRFPNPGPTPWPPPNPCAPAAVPAINSPATTKTNRPAIVTFIFLSSPCVPGVFSQSSALARYWGSSSAISW